MKNGDDELLTGVNADGDDVRKRHEIFRRKGGLDADGKSHRIDGAQRQRNGFVDSTAQLAQRHVILDGLTAVNEVQSADGQFDHAGETLLERASGRGQRPGLSDDLRVGAFQLHCDHIAAG